MQTLSEAVYKTIFPPEGSIPFKAKRNIQAIDARIKEIEQLAEGKAVEGMTRRIGSKAESQHLTEQIVQLRDSCNPPMGYREIMKRLGHIITPDAARNRYDDYKQKLLKAEAYSAMSGIPQKTEMQDHISDPNKMISPTVRNSRIVEEIAEEPIRPESEPEPFTNQVNSSNQQPENAENPQEPDTDQAEIPIQDQKPTIRESRTVENDTNTYAVPREASALASANGPKIPHSEDDFIIAQRLVGVKFADILTALRAKGINCTLKDIENRYYTEFKGRNKPENGKLLQPSEKPQSDIVALSRQELDEWIWRLWKGGMKPDKISEKLVEDGYQYSEASVRRRLLQQGADL